MHLVFYNIFEQDFYEPAAIRRQKKVFDMPWRMNIYFSSK